MKPLVIRCVTLSGMAPTLVVVALCVFAGLVIVGIVLWPDQRRRPHDLELIETMGRVIAETVATLVAAQNGVAPAHGSSPAQPEERLLLSPSVPPLYDPEKWNVDPTDATWPDPEPSFGRVLPPGASADLRPYMGISDER